MKAINNWNDIQAAGNYDRPGPGGYVCVIKKVTDFPDKEYLELEVDIVEGEYKNYAADTAERAGFWPLRFRKSYKTKALGWFKAMITAIEETNSGYKWAWDEKSLVNKGIGIVFQEEEYEGRDGKVKTRLQPYDFKTANEIRSKDFDIPDRKLLDHVTATPQMTEEEDDGTLPF